jgi:hypothetical protein
MKMCNTHMHDLHSAIKRKGMGSMVSGSAEEATRKARLWLDGRLETPADFDPLVASTLEVFNKAKENVGDLPDSVCPLCAVDRVLSCATTWVDNVTDIMVLVCETNNLRRG